MEVRFYAIAEALGLLTDLRELPGDETWQVSVKADEVFFWLGFGVTLILFAAAFALGMAGKRHWLRPVVVILAIYALTLAVGIGPYVKFYPTGGSFIDLSVIEHILEGILMGLRALVVWLCGKLGQKLRLHTKKEAPSC